MAPAAPTRRQAFTLIELLVVVAIMGLLAVTVIPTIGGNINSRRYREAAREAAAFIARCQSRSIGAKTPKGAMLQPLTANPSMAVDLFFSDTPDIYSGETSSSSAVISGLTNATTGPLTVTFDAATQSRFAAQPTFCQAGDAIQFGGMGPRYKFLPPNQVTMWFEDNQTPRNSAWPRASGAGLPFKIWRQPTRGPGGSLQLQKGAAIDLYWSCLGSRPFSSFMGTTMTDNSISILFDASGKPLEIVHSGGLRTTVGEPVFLLIGEGDLAGNSYDPSVSRDTTLPEPADRGGANWQYGDSVWLCIDNNSGVVKTANVTPNSTSVIASQRALRLSVAYGGGER